MAVVTITGLTAARMIEIEQASVVSGKVEGDNLILTTKGGRSITAGNVRGKEGEPGPVGNMRDASSTETGAVQLAGNLGGTAEEPKVTGALGSDVNIAHTSFRPSWRVFLQLQGYDESEVEDLFESEFQPEYGGTVDDDVGPEYADAMSPTAAWLNIYTLWEDKADVYGPKVELWRGTMDDYTALPSSTRNSASFVAFIVDAY